jgi:hypothetical protein
MKPLLEPQKFDLPIYFIVLSFISLEVVTILLHYLPAKEYAILLTCIYEISSGHYLKKEIVVVTFSVL